MFEGMGDAGEAHWRLGGWGVGRAWGQKSGFPSTKLDLFNRLCHTVNTAMSQGSKGETMVTEYHPPVHVSLNVIGGVTISTVRLSKAFAVGGVTGYLYETCIFEPDDKSYVLAIYERKEDAIAGHNRILKEQLTRV